MEWFVKIRQTALEGVCVVVFDPVADHRGMFTRYYCEKEMSDIIGSRHIVQINFSRTHAQGTIRGLHFQYPPHAEMKLVRCTSGKVWDVVVDLRAGSPTFLQWHGEELTHDDGCMLIIPEGCAHGFQVLEEGSELLYLHTAFYTPEAEGGVSCHDPRLNIQWPHEITEISDRDQAHPIIVPDFQGVQL